MIISAGGNRIFGIRLSTAAREVLARKFPERPAESDYFVLKPKHSGFYATTLDPLLEYLQADKLILTGIAANICVIFTANDAYMRDYTLFVPSDCVASNTAADTEYSLRQIKSILKGDIGPSTSLISSGPEGCAPRPPWRGIRDIDGSERIERMFMARAPCASARAHDAQDERTISLACSEKKV